MFVANLSQARELNPTREDSINGDINTNNYILTYQLSLIEQNTSVFLSANSTKMKSQLLQDANAGITVGSSKTWTEKRLNLSASLGYLLAERNHENGTILTG